MHVRSDSKRKLSAGESLGRDARRNIRFQRPELPTLSEIEFYFGAARKERWFSNNGPCNKLLVGRLADYVGRGVRVVTSASGTTGLMVALRAVIDRSDKRREVIVPSFTFIATLNAIIWNGLDPVYVDVDHASWHLDPVKLADALEARRGLVKAVVACSTFGVAPSPQTTRAWESICQEYEVPLVVDSAAGFGSTTADGQPLGAQGDIEVFSFHATKPFAIGEGGAVVTRDESIARRVRELINFGFDSQHLIQGIDGLNGKLSELPAAVGLAVLDRFDSVLAARRERAESLRSRLAGSPFEFQAGSETSTWQFVPVLSPSRAVAQAVHRDAPGAGIEVRSYHLPLHTLGSAAPPAVCGDLTVTLDLAERSLSLPMANDLVESDLDRIADLLLSASG